jgi:hypothetical protein
VPAQASTRPWPRRTARCTYLTSGYKLSADVRHQLIEVVNGYYGEQTT